MQRHRLKQFTEEAETISENAPQNLGHTEDYFIVYGGKTFQNRKKCSKKHPYGTGRG